MRQELIEKITKKVNAQEGQNYPCSNQVVVCCFIGTVKDWENFLKKTPSPIKRIKPWCREVILENNERWVHILPTNNHNECRGYRFYKVKAPSWIDEKFFAENIYCYMALYCCEIEFY